MIQECWYFGCIDEPGHYLFAPDGSRSLKHPLGIWTEFDCAFAPGGWLRDRLGVWQRTATGGWTVIACWDRSVDSRRSSNAAFIVEGKHTLAAALEAAKATWPVVTARVLTQFTDPLKEAKP